ncbi:MAG: radical SAM protein [Clostridiales bacterium]|nr:radical SAM protein [Clostridiales bacterium]
MNRSISIELTKKCNLFCRYCYAQTDNCDSKIFINKDKLIKFFKKFKQEGGEKVLLTGGEMFLHKDVLNIMYSASEEGLILDIFTNGTLINDRELSAIINCVNQVYISLDGPATVQKNLSGVDCYERVYQTIRLLDECGVNINLQVMVVPQNLENLGWLSELIHGHRINTVRLAHVSRTGKGKYASDLFLNEQQLELLLKTSSILMNESNYKTRVVTNIITYAMRNVFYKDFRQVLSPWMLPDGSIYACYNMLQDYWKISDYEMFPEVNEKVERHLNDLNNRLIELTEGRKYFDLFETIHQASDEMIMKEI